jgi:hypothetical protein
MEADMHHTHTTLLVTTSTLLRLCAIAAVSLLALGTIGWTQGRSEKAADRGAVSLFATIPIPGTSANTTGGNMYSFDVSWVDQASHSYYLADRSNAVVDVVDVTTDTVVAQLQGGFKGFTGSGGTSGPNGVTSGGHCLFVSDAPSRVVSFDTSSLPLTLVSAISTASGDLNRADKLAFDPQDSVILAINDVDTPAFGTFIAVNSSTCGLSQPTAPPAGTSAPDRVLFTAASGVDATNGAGQPQWDPDTGRFFLSIPQIGPNVSAGGVVQINPATHTIEKTFPVSFCQPAGLSKGSNEFLVGCSAVFDTAGAVWTATDPKTAAPVQVILDVQTGTVTPIAGVGGSDEVWFNSGDGNYYTGSSSSPLRPLDLGGPIDAQGAGILGIIDADGKNLIQLVPTFTVPPITGTGAHPVATPHSVAANITNNQIFVPLGANNVFPGCLTGCIAVYTRPAKVQ